LVEYIVKESKAYRIYPGDRTGIGPAFTPSTTKDSIAAVNLFGGI